MRQRVLEIWVGIFMIIGIGSLLMLALQVSGAGLRGGETYRLEARFDNIGGLTVKAPVMIGGVRVGRVGEIWIDQEEYVPVVGMDIDKKYDALSVDSSAAILTAGLLGSQYVGLTPGFDEIYLEQGDTVEFTQSALQFETLISQFMFNQSTGNDEAGE